MSDPPVLSTQQIKDELKRLRQGPGLERPGAVLGLSPQLRTLLLGGSLAAAGEGENVVRVVEALRAAVDALGNHERLCAKVDLNLAAEHSHQTLTERQESLAASLRCASKTVRRHSDQALDTLALLLATGRRDLAGAADPSNGYGMPSAAGIVGQKSWRRELAAFWGLSDDGRVDIVCSEIPDEERPYFASPKDRNYLRYAKFADLDSLIFVRTHLARLAPDAVVRDFSPSEYYDSVTDVMVVIGGPPWNAKYREFLPQLPYYFEPNALGEDDPLVVPALGGIKLGPRWTAQHELLEDLAVFTRLTLAQGTRVFLLGGCLTLGVLAAAKCFLLGEQGARNSGYVQDRLGERDFVLVTEARRIGGLSDSTELASTEPLLLMSRDRAQPFAVDMDNTRRYGGVR